MVRVGDALRELPSLLAIVGPTGSGKTRLAVEVAEAVGGEIVSADAFAVYRGLDIGTDKPGPELRARVPHHLVDVADPRERFSAGRFATDAADEITDIRARGSTPIVAGGTHFWVRALLVGLFPSPPHDPQLRARLAADWRRDPQATFHRLEHLDPVAAARIGPGDRQRILRALEVYELTGTPLSEHWRRHRPRPRYRSLLVAPAFSRKELYVNIETRVDSMFASGLEEEVRALLASGVPRDAHAMKAIGYGEVARMLEGQIDRATAMDQTKIASRRLAKRQLTWLRSLREGRLHWVPPTGSGGTDAALVLWNDFLREGGRR